MSAAPQPVEPRAIAVDILIEAGDWGPEPDVRALIERAVAAVAGSAAVDVPVDAELSVLLTDDARIRVLNRDYRGADKATNVLSFPVSDDPDSLDPMLGDIVVARETLVAEALDAGIPVAHHMTHLVVHGLLHLFGYDHEDDDEADAMERVETAILAELGIPDPYSGSDPVRHGAWGPVETKAR